MEQQTKQNKNTNEQKLNKETTQTKENKTKL